MNELFRFIAIQTISSTDKQGTVNDSDDYRKSELGKAIQEAGDQKAKEEVARSYLQSQKELHLASHPYGKIARQIGSSRPIDPRRAEAVIFDITGKQPRNLWSKATTWSSSSVWQTRCWRFV